MSTLPAPKRIAVIGGGISGMGAAWHLSEHHEVVLFEAENRLGGHARTRVAGKNGDQPVDTGFIVFNYANYPQLAKMFDHLDVPVKPSNMSFGASIDGGRIEYALASLDTIFAQRRNLARPSFLRMVRDVVRFNNNAERVARDPDQTIGGLLEELGTGQWFRDYYITPFSGAIWSSPVEKILDFPAKTMVDFFRNHALLSHDGQHQWYTVDGGSISYVTRLQADLVKRGVQLRLGAPIKGVRRVASGAEVMAQGAEWERFDEIVFATHSDDSLALLSDATPREKADLGAILYQPNDVVLHGDSRVMPNRRKCWSSWNYTEDRNKTSDRIDLTYWMNLLQTIPQDDPLFVTLNSTRTIREELIYDQTVLRHPVYDVAAMAARERIAQSNGTDHTWFCGAWMKNGFHEDGLSSGTDVAKAILAKDVAGIAAQ